MNLGHVQLVQTTFALVQPEADLFATRLFNHLFRLDPCLCYLFPKEMASTKETFMAGLADIVTGLERPYPLIQHTLKPLSHKHARLQIQPEQYHAFATALHLALVDTLGSQFTSEAEAAWIETYYLIVGIMKEVG